ncbi:MAG TPA: glycosyltransferase family 2 protein [Burkholderiales bacterium]|nr:glycosyltransferase family 2 protein [Burkholderiales bacterium]
MHIAVIATTYNRPDALAAMLEGYLGQHDRDFELIVADDGSTEDTAQTVRAFQSRASMPIHRVWQEDQGFRAAAIRNRALAGTAAEYIIFTDGDCIPVPRFVARHRELAEPGWFVAGNRVLLSEELTRAVLQNKLPVQGWSMREWLRAWQQGEINRFLPLLSLPHFAPLRELTANRWQGVKTCNLAAWRKDLLMVNGLDETYSGWGLEDSDLVIRLLHAGIKHKSARFAAPVLHLWHSENDRGKLPENQKRLDEVLRSKRVRAVLGVEQYL